MPKLFQGKIQFNQRQLMVAKLGRNQRQHPSRFFISNTAELGEMGGSIINQKKTPGIMKNRSWDEEDLQRKNQGQKRT
jgi:hypothetical protein